MREFSSFQPTVIEHRENIKRLEISLDIKFVRSRQQGIGVSKRWVVNAIRLGFAFIFITPE